MEKLRIGTTQQSCLESLYQRKGWYPMCGWIWNNRSVTIRIMETLVKRGLVDKSGTAETPVYTLNDKGREHLKVTSPYLFKWGN